MKKNIIFLAFLCFANASDDFYYQNNKKIFLEPLQFNKQNRLINLSKKNNLKYYKTSNGKIVGISNELIVKLKNGNVLKDIIKKYPVILKKRLKDNLYLLETNSIDTLTVCNKIYKEMGVIYAHPNLTKKIDKR